MIFNTTQTKLFWNICLLACFTLLVVFSGCSKPQVEQDKPENPCAGFPKTHGCLSHLRESTHPELSKEYALLVEQQHTPCQLMKLDAYPGRNTAALLRKAFSRSRTEDILADTNFLTRDNRFEFDPLLLKKIRTLAEDYKYKNILIREAVELPNCIFEYKHTQGLMADDSFIEDVQAASQLQELAAANYIYNTRRSSALPNDTTTETESVDQTAKTSSDNSKTLDPDLKETINCVQTIFKLAGYLSEVKQIRARLTAESIRAQACRILEAVVHDPRCDQETLVELRKVVQDALAQWSSDAEMWIGDRALGLYTYEVVRDGLILSILTEEEEAIFSQDGTLKYLTETTRENADEDQIYYLKTMRNLIDSCQRDFYKRPLLGQKIVEDLENLEHSLNYPIVAAKILLPGVDKALLLQMIDLTRVQAWSVALDIATGKKPQENINPINGEPFLITQTEKEIIVRATPEEGKAELDSPLDEEAKLFIAKNLGQPVIIPQSTAKR